MEDFSINYKDTYIHAKLEMPDIYYAGKKEQKDKLPIVIVVHGLTGSMDEGQLVAVCEAANRAKMASMRLELFGHGSSGGDFYRHKVSTWVDQIDYILDYVSNREEFSDIYLVGHSQGGLASLLVPTLEQRRNLKALILMSPAVLIATQARIGRFFDTQFDINSIPEDLTFWDGFTVSSDYIRDAMKLPLEEAVHNFKKPVLIVHGTEDECVPFKDSVELEKEYENATLIPIEGDLHCFDKKTSEMADSVWKFLEIMNKTVSVKVMRESDAWTIQNLTSSKELMQRAGKGIFESCNFWAEPVGIICGKGNNAGDGFVVAKLMKDAGIECEIVLLSDDFSEDGKYFHDVAKDGGVKTVRYTKETSFDGYGSIVDCIFGTGFKNAPTGISAEAIEKINNAGENGTYVVSADINSGLNGDTGRGICYVKSDLTVSIGSFKYGHFLGNADDAMKKKINVDIGIKIVK